MKTCMNTITIGPEKPLKQTIEHMGHCKFEGIEIEGGRIDDYLKTEPFEYLVGDLRNARLRVAGIMAWPVNGFSDVSEAAKNLKVNAQRAETLGSDVLLAFIAEAPPKDTSRADAIKAYARVARKYGEIAADFSAKVALELIGGHPVVGALKDLLEVADASGRDNVGIMMDTFHYYKAGISPEEVAEVPGERMLIVHINDCKDKPRDQLKDMDRLYCGEGVIPLKDYLAALESIGYDGYLSVELFNQDYWADDPAKVIRRSKESLDKILAEV